MLTILTADTPNGVKVPIALEELGLPYELTLIDLAAGQQRQPGFRALNPNGRIPVLIDSAGPDGPITIFESGAILIYLAERYGGLLPIDAAQRMRALEYLFLQVSGVGPMFGQLRWFRHSAPAPVEFALSRFRDESLRLTGVLEQRLAQSPWLAGAEYSIADIANFGWLRVASYAGISLDTFAAVREWMARIESRPAVARALARLRRAASEPSPIGTVQL